ncbi:MAG: 50S ribosomal protein L10 [Bacteroidales bacterium]|nr:50S ribosomal protein L10 [Bacteroidales bacterium]
MTREEKNKIIDELYEQIQQYSHFYITDIANMNASDTSILRRKCFEKNIKLVTVKNTLFRKALERFDGKYSPLFDTLKGGSSIMFSNSNSEPAKLIKELRKKQEKPLLKAAFVEESIYIGDNQLDTLASIKSKEELIGDIILMLQSPIRNVISSLESGKHILAGVVKTLSDKNN